LNIDQAENTLKLKGSLTEKCIINAKTDYYKTDPVEIRFTELVAHRGFVKTFDRSPTFL